MPFVAPPFPPVIPYIPPDNLQWALAAIPCAPVDLECRARANQVRDTISQLTSAYYAKYASDKLKYDLKWAGNRTATGMPIAAGYENQYDSRGIYIGPGTAVSSVNQAVNAAVRAAATPSTPVTQAAAVVVLSSAIVARDAVGPKKMAKPKGRAVVRPRRVSSASSVPEANGAALADALNNLNAAAAANNPPAAPAARRVEIRQVYCGYGCILRPPG